MCESLMAFLCRHIVRLSRFIQVFTIDSSWLRACLRTTSGGTSVCRKAQRSTAGAHHLYSEVPRIDSTGSID